MRALARGDLVVMRGRVAFVGLVRWEVEEGERRRRMFSW